MSCNTTNVVSKLEENWYKPKFQNRNFVRQSRGESVFLDQAELQETFYADQTYLFRNQNFSCFLHWEFGETTPKISSQCPIYQNVGLL
jgi:hypothetical protein